METKLNNNLQPGLAARIDQISPQKPKAPQAPKDIKAPGFEDVLGNKGERLKEPVQSPELKFSAHAKTRLESRGIELSSEDLLKMQDAVTKAGQKGSKESLILTDKAAFVVSVKNNTVITAIDKESLKENVFTNIDSTIMI